MCLTVLAVFHIMTSHGPKHAQGVFSSRLPQEPVGPSGRFLASIPAHDYHRTRWTCGERFVPLGDADAQRGGDNPRCIDVHQHFVSPDYIALLGRKRMGGGPQWKNYTPSRNLEDMDKAGIATAMVSPTAPSVWFGDIEESRRAAREINEYAAAKMVAVTRDASACSPLCQFPTSTAVLRN